MRSLRLVSIALMLVWAAGAARGGGFDKDGKPIIVDDVVLEEFKPLPLPVSAKAARTWIALHETMVKPPPDRTPLGEVLRLVRSSARGDGDGKVGPRFDLYFDPVILQEAEITLATPVESPFVGPEEVSLHTYLSLMLRQFGFIHYVHDGMVIIDSPCDDCAGYPTVGAARAWAWLMLQEVVPLKFPDETPLSDVLQAIRRATAGKGPGGRGLAIHVDHIALKQVEKTLASKVTLDLERAPLCTALDLVLRQLGLEFVVRDDGIVSVTVVEGESEPADEAEVILEYQNMRYYRFHSERERMEEERRRRAERPEPAGRPGVAGGAGATTGPRP